jgi:hypothetical protein
MLVSVDALRIVGLKKLYHELATFAEACSAQACPELGNRFVQQGFQFVARYVDSLSPQPDGEVFK